MDEHAHRAFRFGVVGESIRSGAELAATALRAEELGYSTLTLRDHFVPEPFGDQLAPMVALASAAAVTDRLRLGTMVLVRVGRLKESLRILRGLLSGERTVFTGEYYRVDGLTVFPRPARRERYGFAYYQVPDTSMEEFAEVVGLLAD